MTPIEKSKLIDELFSLRKADQGLMESERKRMETERKRLDDLLDSFQVVNVELRALRVQLSDLLNQLAAKDAENASLREELKLSRKNLYGKKSRHGCSSKKKDSVSREESKDDFDDTSGYLPCCGEEPSPSGEVAPTSTASPKEVRLYRIGMDYCRMTLSNWLAKGSVFVNKLVDVLKEKCLDKDAVLNCDETWCRVKVKTPTASVISAAWCMRVPSSRMTDVTASTTLWLNASSARLRVSARTLYSSAATGWRRFRLRIIHDHIHLQAAWYICA